MIYGYVFTAPSRCLYYDEFNGKTVIRSPGILPSGQDTSYSSLNLSLNYVNHSLAHETRHLALKLNTLIFRAPDPFCGPATAISNFCLFMSRLSPAQRAMVRRVEVLNLHNTYFGSLSKALEGEDGVPGLADTC
ncbi:uncharacterized protein BDZ99DRAFT_119534 [Mytilinidion resinicola]|uniref:Uncharacterized protein n=1 Tax=Mytilinidion resinicola TaxID=574789 RepID=A0A6A6Z4N4_9PEZI|nr:uncharacterized protein BDZ99DRAFT_119534 [Mytilinidion resinicola]KAF2815623.1 hypothetical protein BDZ99DRAFT_119534 [Mytilinidion resinicola]